jgi:hypothetical protein
LKDMPGKLEGELQIINHDSLPKVSARRSRECVVEE